MSFGMTNEMTYFM
jgi:hypothetical protein